MRSQIGLLKHQDKKRFFKKIMALLWKKQVWSHFAMYRPVKVPLYCRACHSLKLCRWLDVRSVTIPSDATLTNYATANPVGFYFENKNIHHPRRGGAQRVRWLDYVHSIILKIAIAFSRWPEGGRLDHGGDVRSKRTRRVPFLQHLTTSKSFPRK